MSEQVASPPAPPIEQPGSAPSPDEPVADGTGERARNGSDAPQAGGHGDADTGGSGGADADRVDDPEADTDRPAASGAGVVKVLGLVGVVVALLVVAGLKFGVGTAVDELLHPNRVGTAKAGDCLTELPEVTGAEERSVRDVEVVTCTSGEAVYTVAGRVEDQTEAQARSGKACERYLTPSQEAYVFYRVEPGRTGYLLCLTRKA